MANPTSQKPTEPRWAVCQAVRPTESWAVLQVFSKRAGRIRSEAEDLGCGGFLPTYARVRYVDGKRSSTERQLLPGYLFVRLLPEDRAAIAELEGVYRILPGEARRLEAEMGALVVGHATGRWNEVEAPPAERRRRRRRRPRAGRRFRGQGSGA